MEKHGFRNWAAVLEGIIDKKLKKWLKGERIENGEAVHFSWQFEQTHMFLDIFWEDKKETVHFTYLNPRTSHRYEWHGLNDSTINKITDRVGNLAMVTMHPPQGLDE